MIKLPFLVSRHERVLKKYQQDVKKINALEKVYSQYSDAQLQAQTKVLQNKLAKTARLDSVIHDAFALVREASKRVLNMRHYDVQLIGGLCLAQRQIPEMKTGEGKTLVATLGAYVWALYGKGVHVITVNPYLAERDAQLVRPLHEFLGLTVGVISSEQDADEKRQAYACDITYGTNSEFGFDYLRDHLVEDLAQKVQRGHFSALVDEVDSVLIDEARTPLIISGMSEQDISLLPVARRLAMTLSRQVKEDSTGDVYINEKEKRCTLSEEGLQKVEALLHEWDVLEEGSHYQERHLAIMGLLDAALKAEHLYAKDVDYLIDDDEVKIIDSFTGRVQEGRRWSDGLHQAIEVKESVPLQGESITLSSITYQNYFRMYEHLSGMTGTADTEAREFFEIYNLETIVIPTNRPMQRKDSIDAVYLTHDAKMNAVVGDILKCHEQGQPVLVGTTSVEQSEWISNALQQKNIEHQVLNAKNHAKEAAIIAQAGRLGSITIATNMAGRGTDILLGGNPAFLKEQSVVGTSDESIEALCKSEKQRVIELGGLHVIGTERHESRRVDNQLRGRAGRQGDPGSSKFYLSLEDTLLRIFGGDRLLQMVNKMGMADNEALESAWLSRTIEKAQQRVENQNYEVRKQLLEYDDVANAQRKAFYVHRDAILRGEIDNALTVRDEMLYQEMVQYIPPNSIIEEWDIKGLLQYLEDQWDVKLDAALVTACNEAHEVHHLVTTKAHAIYNEHLGALPSEVQHQMIASTMIKAMDMWWQRHLTELDALREGIHLRAYAQQDPKQIYKKEAFSMFESMVQGMKLDTAKSLQLSRILYHIPHEGAEFEPQIPTLDGFVGN